MPRGGHNKKKVVPPSGPAALTAWPKAPVGFSKAEAASWERMGVAALPLGSVSVCDLVLVERLAQLDALVTKLLRDPDAAPGTVSSMLRLQADMLNRLGLTPQSRNTVGLLAKPAKPSTPLDEF